MADSRTGDARPGRRYRKREPPSVAGAGSGGSARRCRAGLAAIRSLRPWLSCVVPFIIVGRLPAPPLWAPEVDNVVRPAQDRRVLGMQRREALGMRAELQCKLAPI